MNGHVFVLYYIMGTGRSFQSVLFLHAACDIII